MSWHKLCAAGALVVSLAGCGFEPIAAPSAMDAATQSGLTLAKLEIVADGLVADDRFSYRVRREMSRYVDVGMGGAGALVMHVAVSEEGLAIQSNDAVSRYNYRAVTKYELTIPGREPVKGSFGGITAVNATSSQFSTSVAQQDAYERLAADAARQMLTILRLNHIDRLPRPDGAG